MFESKRVCCNCLSDPYLHKLISEAPERHLRCDYCHSDQPTMSIEMLADQCQWLIDNFYYLADFDDMTGEYNGDPLVDVLGEEIRADESVIMDLAEELTDRWFDYSSGSHTYGSSPHFESAITINGELSGKWSAMEKKLQESNRFFNLDAQQTLDDVFGYIFKNHPSAVLQLPVETTKLYRARVFQSEAAMEKGLQFPEANFGPPPSDIAPSGRMNARGISVFYGAFDAETAIAEVRPPVGSRVVVAEFSLLRPARLLDLTQLRSLTVRAVSKFDPEYFEQYQRCYFFRRLSRQLVMPVVPELQERNYLLTQAIADYLSTHRDNEGELDGIMFPSAQTSSSFTESKKMNVTLFHKSSSVMNASERRKAADVELYSYDDNVTSYEPIMTTTTDDFRKDFAVLKSKRSTAAMLKINLDKIEVNEIRGVEYRYNTTEVIHQEHPGNRSGRKSDELL